MKWFARILVTVKYDIPIVERWGVSDVKEGAERSGSRESWFSYLA